MAAIKFTLFLFSILFINVLAANVDTISSDLKIKNVDRVIDLASQLVKISSKISLENVGKSPVKYFLLAVEGYTAERLAFIGVKDKNGRDLRVIQTSVTSKPKETFWRVELKELAAGATVLVTVDVVYTKSLEPYPAAITQQEQQLVKYFGNLHFYSPYPTDSQKTNIVLQSKHIESFTKVKPFSQSDANIQYGPYLNIKPFSQSDLNIHFRNNAPFLTVSRVERLIEVSHWGNIAVEEVIDIYHSGAKLNGAFSRYDYQQDSQASPSSVKSYKTFLPAAAADVYYRDANGNISTSQLKVKKDTVEVELRPRYPLFGGWKTQYLIGYNVPSYEYLFYSGNEFLLKMRAVDHIFDDMVIEELKTKIVLPEGSTKLKLTPPYDVSRLSDSLHYTYLDTSGRPVVEFTKRNVVENHIQDFQLRYSFPRIMMAQEPLLVVAFLFSLFLCVIFYVRLDFSIHKKEHKD